MIIQRPWVKGLVYILIPLAVSSIFGTGPRDALAQSPPDSLTLQKAENITLWRTYDASSSKLVVYVTWEEPPDSMSAFIHPPDTTGWSLLTSPDSLSHPSSRGWYTGNIDRTVTFKAAHAGSTIAVVGEGTLVIDYSIRKEEDWNGTLDLGTSYTPGTWIPVIFKRGTQETLDLGLELSFTPGIIDGQAQFVVGLEDFEGFHVWRGIDPDGSDLEVIGEISKEEAYRGTAPGGSAVDSLYIYEIIPSLRATGVYNSPFSIDCLGFTLRADLEDNELLWFDCNAFNGFTYQYYVTTFDRGYIVSSSRQGLNKIDRCQPTEGVALPDSCRSEFATISIEVNPQSNLKGVYAVPNPFRTGGSRLTTANYHNFPDDKIRFVNVPENCTIRIYTVSGDLVWDHQHNGPGGNIEWDATNRGGEPVASGVYIFRVEDSSGGDVYGRLIIIR
jgi:hypothetical protein